MDILIARPYDDAKQLAELFKSSGLSVGILPSIKIVHKKINFKIENFTDFVFTSKYAVESLFSQYLPSNFMNKSIYSVGATTANHLAHFNLNAKYPKEYNSKELFKLISKQGLSDRKFAIFSGVDGNEYLEKEINKHTTCQKFEIYQRAFESKETLYTKYLRLWGDKQPRFIITTSIDVFKSLNAIFEKIPIPKDSIVTITSTKMLKFVNSQGFSNTLKLEKLSNYCIYVKILQHIEANDYVSREK
ncbi:uroporphyrinogen-III synthase [Allofrancisella inopinata]|uniref:Uroporphyrinogen-III synthase n=1 Tax=Allofrancisella inopinata TaxID=1085647 RepID=A0AAE6YIZ5_9GAMM|nr:uroporphyrinogen-III synthase [Allofrancisella inopinata]QIV96337.1 uroporphyrinogen-III synthase [Allofrancisella inopinata]TDT66687.1 uroporphyrinogen-III synthase [Allofrancisella inopinata]